MKLRTHEQGDVSSLNSNSLQCLTWWVNQLASNYNTGSFKTLTLRLMLLLKTSSYLFHGGSHREDRVEGLNVSARNTHYAILAPLHQLKLYWL